MTDKTLEQLQQELIADPNTTSELAEWKTHLEVPHLGTQHPSDEYFLSRRREMHGKGKPFLFASQADNNVYFSTYPDYGRAVVEETDDWAEPIDELEKLKEQLLEYQNELKQFGAMTEQQIEYEKLVAAQNISSKVAEALRDKQEGDVEGFGALVSKHYMNIVTKDVAQKKFDEVSLGIDFSYLEQDLSVEARLQRDSGKGLPWRFRGLMKQGHITTITAVRKAGKSTFALNRLKSYVDGDSLFGLFEATPVEGKVLYLNYELQELEINEWITKINIRNKDKIIIWDLNGKNMLIQHKAFEERLTQFCIDNNVEVLEIDPLQSALKSGDTKDEREANEFSQAVARIKAKAGIKDVVLTTHMGKAALREDSGKSSETSMGASKWEGWPDNLIIFKRIGDDGVTSEIRIDQGRGIQLEPVRLTFDEETYRMTYSGTRAEIENYERAKRQIDFLNKLPEDYVVQNDFLSDKKNGFGSSGSQSELKSFIEIASTPTFGWVELDIRARGQKFIKRGPRWRLDDFSREDPRLFAQYVVANIENVESGKVQF